MFAITEPWDQPATGPGRRRGRSGGRRTDDCGSEAVVAWSRKRSDYLRVGINLVEIDLLRGGIWTLPDRSLLKPVPPARV